MDIFSLLEQLACTVHHSNEKNHLIKSLERNSQISFVKSGPQELRRQMSSSQTADFPDARTVVQG